MSSKDSVKVVFYNKPELSYKQWRELFAAHIHLLFKSDALNLQLANEICRITKHTQVEIDPAATPPDLTWRAHPHGPRELELDVANLLAMELNALLTLSIPETLAIEIRSAWEPISHEKPTAYEVYCRFQIMEELELQQNDDLAETLRDQIQNAFPENGEALSKFCVRLHGMHLQLLHCDPAAIVSTKNIKAQVRKWFTPEHNHIESILRINQRVLLSDFLKELKIVEIRMKTQSLTNVSQHQHQLAFTTKGQTSSGRANIVRGASFNPPDHKTHAPSYGSKGGKGRWKKGGKSFRNSQKGGRGGRGNSYSTAMNTQTDVEPKKNSDGKFVTAMGYEYKYQGRCPKCHKIGHTEINCRLNLGGKSKGKGKGGKKGYANATYEDFANHDQWYYDEYSDDYYTDIDQDAYTDGMNSALAMLGITDFNQLETTEDTEISEDQYWQGDSWLQEEPHDEEYYEHYGYTCTGMTEDMFMEEFLDYDSDLEYFSSSCKTIRRPNGDLILQETQNQNSEKFPVSTLDKLFSTYEVLRNSEQNCILDFEVLEEIYLQPKAIDSFEELISEVEEVTLMVISKTAPVNPRIAMQAAVDFERRRPWVLHFTHGVYSPMGTLITNFSDMLILLRNRVPLGGISWLFCYDAPVLSRPSAEQENVEQITSEKDIADYRALALTFRRISADQTTYNLVKDGYYQYFPFAQSNHERIIPIPAAFSAAVTVNLDYRPVEQGFPHPIEDDTDILHLLNGLQPDLKKVMNWNDMHVVSVEPSLSTARGEISNLRSPADLRQNMTSRIPRPSGTLPPDYYQLLDTHTQEPLRHSPTGLPVYATASSSRTDHN